MKSSKHKIFFLAGIFLFVLTSTIIYILPIQAQQEPDVHIKVEVSKDGSTWYNWAGTEFSGGQTYTCNTSNDSCNNLLIRMKIWNSGPSNASNIQGSGNLDSPTFAPYISANTLENADADNNGTSFTGDYFKGSGLWTISQVDANSTENSGYESITAKVTLINENPGTEVTISATGTVSSYSQPYVLPEPDKGTSSYFSPKVAHAQQPVNRNSTIRITIVNGAALPATGADL